MKTTLFFVTLLITTCTFAEEKPKEDKPAPEAKFTCVKSRKITLADFKEKMMEECDLNRPFSASTADNALETSYMFCCHKK